MATYYDIYKKYEVQNRDSQDYYDAGKVIPFRVSMINWNTPSNDKLRLYCPKSGIVVVYREWELVIAIPKLDKVLIYDLNTSWGDIKQVSISSLKHSEDNPDRWEINRCGISEYKKADDKVDEAFYEALIEPWE